MIASIAHRNDPALRRPAGLALLVLGIGLSICVQPAFGHAGLVSSEPGRRAVLTLPPKQIRLCFNERIELKFSKLTLLDASGTELALGALQAEAEKPACVLAPVAALAPGSYTVKFRVLSVDGHVVDKSYGFSLKAPPAP